MRRWRHAAVGLLWAMLTGGAAAQEPTSSAALVARAADAARLRTGAGFASAAALFDSAARLEWRRGNRARTGVLFVSAAEMSLAQGRPDRASRYADSALLLLPREQAAQVWRVRALDAAAQAKLARGHTAAAIASLDSGLAIAADLIRSAPSDSARRSLGRLAAVLRSDHGNALLEYGQPDSAAGQLAAARKGFADANDSLGTAYVLNNLGRLQQNLGRSQVARALFDSALAIFVTQRDAAGQVFVLSNIGYGFDLASRPDSALTWHRKALAALEASPNEALETIVLNNLGRNQLMLDSLVAAADDVTAGLGVARAMNDQWRAGWALSDLGRIALARGDRDSAIVLLAAARDTLRAAADPAREAGAAFYLGVAYRMPGSGQNLGLAAGQFADAHALRTGISSGVGSDLERVAFAEQDVRLTEEWVGVLLAASDFPGQAYAALEVAELGRARSLLRLMRGTEAPLGAEADLARAGQQLLDAVLRPGP